MYRVRYNNHQKIQHPSQSAGSTSTMKSRILFWILLFVRTLVVQGQDPGILSKNNTDNSSRRIINGAIPNPADFPFLVRLHIGDRLCGGTVISNYFILTAAHCIFQRKCLGIKIFPSTWVQGTTSRIHPVQCYTHQNFVKVYLYDIALIKTREDLLNGGGFEGIPLAMPGTQYSPGTPAVIAGWGQTEDRKYPGRLFRANVTVESWDTCDYKYKHAKPECISDTVCPVPGIPRRGLCTQGQGSKIPSGCYGDSGGPVVINGELAGVIIGSIFNRGQCEIGTPTLHTKVAEYLPWIYSITDPDKDTSKLPVIEEFPPITISQW